MTPELLREWRAWLDRVELRTDVDDVPVLIRRLGRCLDELASIQLALGVDAPAAGGATR